MGKQPSIVSDPDMPRGPEWPDLDMYGGGGEQSA